METVGIFFDAIPRFEINCANVGCFSPIYEFFNYFKINGKISKTIPPVHLHSKKIGGGAH